MDKELKDGAMLQSGVRKRWNGKEERGQRNEGGDKVEQFQMVSMCCRAGLSRVKLSWLQVGVV